MNLFLLQGIDTAALSRMISLTLLHSLWEGTLIYLLAVILLNLTKNIPSSVRYGLLTGLLVVFIFTISLTGYLVYRSSAVSATAADTSTGNPVPGESFADAGVFITSLCNLYSTQIFIVWLFLCCAKSLWLLVSLRSLQRISGKALDVSPEWQEKIKQLATKMGLKRKIRFKLSAIIDQPMVTGFLKPVLLVPFSMLNSLPLQETEAILLHELAHIKRKDHLVNLLQNITGILFFFNPAVYFLSRMIRREREYCCDDMAINVTGDKKIFIRALVSFCEYNLATKNHALYLHGNTNALRLRVSRILNGHSRPGVIEKTVWLLCLVAGICLLSFSATGLTAANRIEKPVAVKAAVSPLPVSGKVFADIVEKSNGKKQLTIGFSVSLGTKKDTVIQNASKEFIAGYRAAQNYLKNGSMPQDKKIDAEKNAIRKKPDKDISIHDAGLKKEKEMLLQQKQRII